tara:strand:+ start:609 stop:1073 length:465 start_codon:yes stop_codon:yes gene_type:complete
MAITYENIFFDFVIDPLRDIMRAEYAGMTVYVAPTIETKYSANVSMRLWGTSAEKSEYIVDGHSRVYNVDVALYVMQMNPNERFYKKLYNDGERLHQLIFENKTKKTTVGSTTLQWADASIENMIINDLDDEESEIEGLHTIKMEFSCNITASV